MSTGLSGEDIKRLAGLARLNVPEGELASVGKDIAAILGFVDTIQTVQLSSEQIAAAGNSNVFRDDAVQALAASHDLIEAAPLHQDHFVKVPKVIE